VVEKADNAIEHVEVGASGGGDERNQGERYALHEGPVSQRAAGDLHAMEGVGFDEIDGPIVEGGHRTSL
jgi:hypothetical protein